jgi:tetratricopeptide (TPR) repeat protein
MNSDVVYKRFFHCSLLCIIVLICYSNTFQNPWHFDDTGNIVGNSSIQIKDLSWPALSQTMQFSPHEFGPFTRPVAALTFALNYYFSSYDTTSYHVVNISLHLITAWLVYLVFQQSLCLYYSNSEKVNSSYNFESSNNISLLASVLWAIHPIHTQAITYIVQRQTVLAAMFYMLAMYCYLKARKTDKGMKQIILILLVGICYSLGVGSKQNAVLLPLSLIGYEVAFFRYSFLDSLRKSRLLQIILFSGVVLLALVLYLKGRIVFDYLVSAYQYRPFSMWERLYTQPIILIKYLLLLFTPLADFLTLDSDIVASKSLIAPPHTLAALIAIISLFLLGLYLLKRKPIIGFAIYFFFANHLIESTFIGLELYFEHRNYLPSMFLYLAISFFFMKIILFYREKGMVLMCYLFVFFGIAILISEGNASYLRNDVWRSEISIMEDSIEKAPNNIRPYITVSSLYMKLRLFEKAKEYLKKAEELYKVNPQRYQLNLPALLYYNAGILYTNDWAGKDDDKALSLLHKSIEIYPGDHLAHIALGALYFGKGEYENAEVAMINASSILMISRDEFPSGFYRNFGRILYSNDRIEDAISAFRKGLESDPSDDLRLNMIALYLQKGNLDLAKIFLDQIPNTNDSPAYLLCVALLNPGQKGDSALVKLAGLLVQYNVSYCEWSAKIHENKAFGIIYPDIKPIERKIKQIYIEAFDRLREDAATKIEKAEMCSFSSETLTEESVPVTSTTTVIN